MAKHLVITGVVQGVGYRAAFEAQARALTLAGWVRNRLDGSVEAVVCGDPQAVEEIIEWAHRGPLNARVRHVKVIDANGSLVEDAIFKRMPTE